MLAVSCSTMSKKDYELLSTGNIQDVQLYENILKLLDQLGLYWKINTI